MTPHHLHALAAAWSLHTARTVLQVHVGREARHNTSGLLNAAPMLRSPTYGTRYGVGDHGDPTETAVGVLSRPARETTWADRQATVDRRLIGIAAMLRIDGVRDPLVCILAAIPRILPGTAAVLARHLADEDALLRRPDWLDMPPAREPLPGVDCPVCAHRTLYVQTAGPVDAWTVVCLAADCHLCTGQGCRCGMPGAVEGVAHIWPRAAVIAGAVAGATPTTTTN